MDPTNGPDPMVSGNGVGRSKSQARLTGPAYCQEG